MGSQDCAQATSGLRELALSLAGLTQWRAIVSSGRGRGTRLQLRKISVWTGMLDPGDPSNAPPRLTGEFVVRPLWRTGVAIAVEGKVTARRECLYFPHYQKKKKVSYLTHTPPLRALLRW